MSPSRDAFAGRPLPLIDQWNEAFWRGGDDDQLHIFQCSTCSYFIHPPSPVCPSCLSRSVGPVAVAGTGTVYSFTVNHQQWDEAAGAEPYVIALVELDEQDSLRVLTNIVGCDPAAIHAGMDVRVEFRHLEDVRLPVFVPVGSGSMR